MIMPYYEKEAQAYVDRTINIDMRPLYKAFQNELPAPDKTIHILDAACGSGRDTRYFLSQGYEVTAFDSTSALVNLASAYTGHPILDMTFEEMPWVEEFDAIWSSACLLHCSKIEIEPIIERFIRALKKNGVWYMSFKEGDGESIEKETGRFFNSYTIDSLTALLVRFPSISLIKVWSQVSLSPGTTQVTWVNALVRKTGVSE